MKTTPYECQQCGEKATIQGRQEIDPTYDSPFIRDYVVCDMCGYTTTKDAMDVVALLAVCKCAEADLYGLVADYMDIDVETSNTPCAKTFRDLQAAIIRTEQSD